MISRLFSTPLRISPPEVDDLSIALMGKSNLPASSSYTSLSRLQSLTSLDLYLEGLESVDDAYLGVITKACPDLEVLAIRPVHTVAVSPNATLETLGTISKYCRCIEYIYIRLDCATS